MARLTIEAAVAKHSKELAQVVLTIQAVSFLLPWWEARDAFGTRVASGHLFVGGSWNGQGLVDPVMPLIGGITALLSLAASSYAFLHMRSRREGADRAWYVVGAAFVLQSIAVVSASTTHMSCTGASCIVVSPGIGWVGGTMGFMLLMALNILLHIQRSTAPPSEGADSEEAETLPQA